MSKPVKNIKIHLLYAGNEHTLETYTNEYANLMLLIYDTIFIEDFGDCKGIGRCGTCHIKILNRDNELLQRQRNEETTLSKMDNIEMTSRLACQILIDEKLDGLHIEVMGDSPGLY